MNDPAVEVVSLVKRYPKRPTNAVDEVDFQVPLGEVFGLLGPNGAGKTTTIGILTTRVVPTAGIARVRGVDVAGIRSWRAACSPSFRNGRTSTSRSTRGRSCCSMPHTTASPRRAEP